MTENTRKIFTARRLALLGSVAVLGSALMLGGSLSNGHFAATANAAPLSAQQGPTGFADLDKKLGGLHPSDLIILAARPSMGKTSLACNVAFDVARNYAWEPQPDGTRKTVRGGVVAFYSLEMSAEQLAMRLLAEVSGVSGDRLRKGEIDASEFGRVRHLASAAPLPASCAKDHSDWCR